MKRDTKKAFDWIVKILRKHNIRFWVTGGLAARVYGSRRPLDDIDFEVRDRDVFVVANLVKKYIIFGPKQYLDKNFNIILMTIRYKGQEIDFSGADSTRLYDSKNKKWVKCYSNLSKAVHKKVFGMIVPVTPKQDLIAYKSKLLRKVDRLDIKALKEN